MRLAVAYRHDNPREHEFPYREAIESYLDLADQVIAIAVNDSEGSLHKIPRKVKVVDPRKLFGADWRKAAFFNADADWILMVEPYQIFHHKNIDETRARLEKIAGARAAEFNQFRFILASRAVKEERVLGFNRNAEQSWESLIKIKKTEIRNIGLFVYAYPHVFLTRHPIGIPKNEEFMAKARADFAKCEFAVQPKAHPMYIQDRIEDLGEQHFGFGGWSQMRN